MFCNNSLCLSINVLLSRLWWSKDDVTDKSPLHGAGLSTTEPAL